jgi:DNA-binding LacI/PurR family transcriptional regulator
MARESGGRARRATMRDVAEQAGVSLQTVSNFVNGRFDQMGEDTRQRVSSTMELLQYRTNVAAASLRSQRSRTLSVLVLDEQSAFLADPLTHLLIAGVSDCAKEHSYGVLIELGQHGISPSEFLSSVKHGRADGAVIQLYGSKALRNRYLAQAQQSGAPIVIVDEIGLDQAVMGVRATQESAAFELTNLLIDDGRTRIAFIGDAVTWAGNEQRISGYRSALRKRGLAVDKTLIRLDAQGACLEGERLARELLAVPDPPTAIMCSSDLLAAGVLKAARAMRLRVPRDLAITGFDDSPFAVALDPALTTVSIPAYEMGRRAAAMLIATISGDGVPEPHAALPAAIVRRQSA